MTYPHEAKEVTRAVPSPVTRAVPSPPLYDRRGYLSRVRRLARTTPLGTIGVVIIVFFAIVAIAAPLLAPYDPHLTNPDKLFLRPNVEHWFGTNMLGQDMLSRVIYGARTSIMVSVIVTVAATAIAGTLGVTSAYFGGKYDLILQRFIDAKSAFPSLLLALAFMAAFGPSFASLIAAMILIFSSRGVRVIRSQVLSIKETPYVDAAHSIGASTLRIMVRHVTPNTFGPMMIIASTTVGSVILVEASLSFLGVTAGGVNISWGALVASRLMRYFSAAPWMVLFPGFALTLLVFGVNVLGDALRDVLDPRMRGRSPR